MLSVADNGCGMSAAFVRDSLFRPFQSTKKKGLGIGMFQSRMIVEAHGGSIQVESEAGKGTTFRVSLPARDRDMTKPTLLIVDDDEDIRTQMKWALADDYEVVMAGDRPAAVAAFTAARPTATLLDLGLPPRPNDPEEGLAVLSGLLVLDRLAKVIVVSGQGDKQNALRAVGAGAYDFLCKPVDMDELRLVLQRCVYVAELEREYRAMQESARPDAFEEMLGASPQMQAVFAFIRKVATTSAPVLILGENGTGQGDGGAGPPPPEPAARRPVRRHQLQRDPREPARERAVRPREGLVHRRARAAQGPDRDGGGRHALPRRDRRAAGAAAGQAAALPPGEDVPARRRPAGDPERRAGDRGHEHQPAGVGREREVPRGPLLPPGRARRHAARPARAGRRHRAVAKEFLRRYGAQHGKPGLTFAPDALRALNLHAWPGNIRELQNRVQRAVIMADGKRVTAERPGAGGRARARRPPQTLKEAREGVERELVEDALRRHGGKITSAALELGISRPTLYELMEKLGIGRSDSN